MAEAVAVAMTRGRPPARPGRHRHRQVAGLPGAGAAARRRRSWSRPPPSRCRTRSSTATCPRWSTPSSRCSGGARRTRSSRAGPTTCAATRCTAACRTTTGTRCSTRRRPRRWAATSCGCATGPTRPRPATATSSSPASPIGPGGRSASPRASAWARPSARYGAECFAELARDRAAEVEIVVTNHALLAIDALESFPLLPEHDAVVVDEAHELVDRVTGVATDELTAAMVERAAAAGPPPGRRTPTTSPTRRGARRGAGVAARGAPRRSCPSSSPPPWRWSATRPATCSPSSGRAKQADDGARKVAARRSRRGARDRRAASPPTRRTTWPGSPATRGAAPVLRVAPLAVNGLLREALFGERAVVLDRRRRSRSAAAFDAVARQVGLTGERRAGVDRAGRGLAVRLPAAGDPVRRPTTAATRPGRHLAGRDGRAGGAGRGGRRPDAGAVLLDARGRGGGRRRCASGSTCRCSARARTGRPTLVRRSPPTRRPACSARCRSGRASTCPGDACRLVVIDRIPFPRPDDPLMSARAQAVADAGGNGFMTVSAAHAALRLAQGSGRLVRAARRPRRRRGARLAAGDGPLRRVPARLPAAVLADDRPRGRGRRPAPSGGARSRAVDREVTRRGCTPGKIKTCGQIGGHTQGSGREHIRGLGSRHLTRGAG